MHRYIYLWFGVYISYSTNVPLYKQMDSFLLFHRDAMPYGGIDLYILGLSI
jgi:hypothetical protein